jgi:CRP/FNR family cyclic AMP-dependent transcriptional regulator
MKTPLKEPSSPSSLPAFLEKWPWYRALSPDLRTLTVDTTVERTVDAGEYVARAGSPSAHWYGLMRGILQMYVAGAGGSETTLYCLREGEWGGEGSLLKKEMRRYDLRALTQSHLCMVPAKTFETLRRSSIEFNHFLCDIMNARMGEFVGMLAASRLRGPEMQVARALLMLANDGGSDTQELAVPQHELALISGLSRQRVNMALSAFRRRGLVRGEPHKAQLVVDLRRLRHYVVNDD